MLQRLRSRLNIALGLGFCTSNTIRSYEGQILDSLNTAGSELIVIFVIRNRKNTRLMFGSNSKTKSK